MYSDHTINPSSSHKDHNKMSELSLKDVPQDLQAKVLNSLPKDTLGSVYDNAPDGTISGLPSEISSTFKGGLPKDTLNNLDPSTIKSVTDNLPVDFEGLDKINPIGDISKICPEDFSSVAGQLKDNIPSDLSSVTSSIPSMSDLDNMSFPPDFGGMMDSSISLFSDSKLSIPAGIPGYPSIPDLDPDSLSSPGEIVGLSQISEVPTGALDLASGAIPGLPDVDFPPDLPENFMGDVLDNLPDDISGQVMDSIPGDVITGMEPEILTQVNDNMKEGFLDSLPDNTMTSVTSNLPQNVLDELDPYL